MIIEEGTTIYITDKLYVFYIDTKGLSDLIKTIGCGPLLLIANKLGLITISSTEKETASTREQMATYTWFWYWYYLLAQGW